MFCVKCGTQLEDGCRFCPQCGAEVVKGSSSVSSNITMAFDSQNMKSKSSSMISSLRSLDKRKTLYGAIISLVLVILFGVMTVNVLNPAKKVEAKVTYAGEPYTLYSTGAYYNDTYYQEISVVYNGKKCSETCKLAVYNPYAFDGPFGSYSVGDMITAYVVDENLTLDHDTAKVNVIGAAFSIILLLGSIGSCGWFALQWFWKRNMPSCASV